MGAWGIGNFENDDALDFVGVFSAGASVDKLIDTLIQVINFKEQPESPLCCEALAAGEVVAALNGKLRDLPDELTEWVASNKENLTSSLLQLATKSAERIKQDSELLSLA
jgi:hypothetical protein